MATNTPETDENAQWLSQEAYDRLSAELEHLKGPGRQEIVERISAARDEGDLKENGGYHAAKEEQGKAEARIAYLTHLLENARVGGTPPDDGVVEPGMLVKAKVAGREMEFLFGNREIAGNTDLSVYSDASPMGEAISGAKEGDKVSYQAPNGSDIEVEILSATPYSG
ncbi:transcription elongation factor GreA [Nesterenkonia sp. MY13]|uniref:Transcription elongation factor GreA n=1 Tax=Nesterenkonia sedimenti TaxID=1463632 RepID=A0A7X8TKN6_9MICC|nr:transcription elongation factor GreA [Nesterenkonia sedimenti]NLS10320.1 transcription elongation factor GreA [Nesterenkonia sedimenti]